MKKQEIIKEYFQAWINNDISIIEKIFSKEILYTECYGPQYKNKNQILNWFRDWQEKGKVISWDIKNIYETEKVIIVEWNFECNWEGKETDFDGVSIVEFDKDNLIINLREFESKSTHYSLYENII